MPRVEPLPSTRPLYSNLFTDIVNIPLQQSYIQIQEKEETQNPRLNLVARQTQSMSKIPEQGQKRKKKAHLDITDIKKITESQITKIHNLNQQISLIKGSFSKWCQVKQQREEELVAKNDYINELHLTIENQSSQILYLKEKIRKSHSITENSQDYEEVKKLKEQVGRRKQTEESLVELNLCLGKQIQNLKNIIKELQRENTQNNEYILKCEQNISELYHQNQKKQANLLEYIDRLQECERKLQFLNGNNSNPQQISCLQMKIDSLSEQNSYLINSLNEKELKINTLNRKVQLSHEQVQSLKISHLNTQERFQNQKANLLRNASNSKSIIVELEKQIQTYKISKCQYQQLIEKNASHLATLLKANTSLQAEAYNLKNKYILLQQKINVEQKVKHQLNEEFRKCKSQIFRFMAKVHRNEEKAYQYAKTEEGHENLVPSFPNLIQYVTETLYCQLIKEISSFKTHMQANLVEIEELKNDDKGWQNFEEIFVRINKFAQGLCKNHFQLKKSDCLCDE